MKKNMGLLSLVPVVLILLPAIVRATDQQALQRKHTHRTYKVVDLGTLGGPLTYLQVASAVLNNRGTVVGWSDTSTPGYPEFCLSPGDGFYTHAFRWRDGIMTELPTLPGGTSSQAVLISPNGLIAGYSNNGQPDPLVFGQPQARAVLWRDGQVFDLGTFGGNQSISYAVNSRGQVAGAALNAIPDPYSFYNFILPCASPNETQTRAFLWDRERGMQDLGSLGTGSDAAAFFVNEAGQVAGVAFTDSTPNPTTGLPTFHPFLWEKGKGMRDLGSIGGAAVFNMSGLNRRGQITGTQTLAGDATWHPFLWDGKRLIDLGTLGGDQDWGNWINDEGDVVGQGALPGAQEFHGFLWHKGKKTDLGLLPGDTFSDTTVINSRGQIVGVSGSDTSASAVLWENGQILDLNTLLVPGSDLMVYWALYINDPGEITAYAVDSSGNNHAVLLIPCDANHPGMNSCESKTIEGDAPGFARPPLSEASKRHAQAVLWRRNHRFLFPTSGLRK